jgi:hypothetical protein
MSVLDFGALLQSELEKKPDLVVLTQTKPAATLPQALVCGFFILV